MRWINLVLFKILVLALAVWPCYGQEEESAEVYLEEYSDQFQEVFFEALKQKGIENYDRAINLFLECKQLQPENEAIDHELAKVYLNQKAYAPAMESAIPALVAEPTNFWYLHTLVEILRVQGRSVIEIKDRIPWGNNDLKKNLAMIYYRQRNYDDALTILKEMNDPGFKEELASKIRDSLEQLKNQDEQNEVKTEPQSDDPLAAYKNRLGFLDAQQEYGILEKEAAEALELFPTQPYFYYMMGKAMSRNNKAALAAEVLEAGLDFLLDDTDLNNQIYRELADVYRALGNPTKANMYLSKVKNGS